MNAALLTWISPIALPRLTLLLNHVVSSEPEALARLRPLSGQSIDILWTTPSQPSVTNWLAKRFSSTQTLPPAVRLTVTPAGMFESTFLEASDPSALAGLTLTVSLPDPLSLAKLVLTGQRPDVSIDGNVALAETASWLMKNLRWDLQEDLANWFGVAPAEVIRSVGSSLKYSLMRWKSGSNSSH